MCVLWRGRLYMCVCVCVRVFFVYSMGTGTVFESAATSDVTDTCSSLWRLFASNRSFILSLHN